MRLEIGEEGVTLIETLVALAIFGVCFAVVIGGMTTSVVVSDHHQKEATAETLLRAFAESQKSSYSNCQLTPSTTVVIGSYTESFTTTPQGIMYWNGATFSTTCPATDMGLQKLSLQVRSNDGRATETVEIVKRKQ